jgi:hypothetical protein
MTNELQHLSLAQEDYRGHDQICVGGGTGLPISHIGSASLTLSSKFHSKSTPSGSFDL